MLKIVKRIYFYYIEDISRVHGGKTYLKYNKFLYLSLPIWHKFVMMQNE